MDADDEVGKLFRIAEWYRRRYPAGDHPTAYVTRLAEELGEIATAVQRLDPTSVKTAKDGPGSIEDLADEVEDLVHTALGLLLNFRAEQAFTATVDRLHALSLDAIVEPS